MDSDDESELNMGPIMSGRHGLQISRKDAGESPIRPVSKLSEGPISRLSMDLSSHKPIDELGPYSNQPSRN